MLGWRISVLGPTLLCEGKQTASLTFTFIFCSTTKPRFLFLSSTQAGEPVQAAQKQQQNIPPDYFGVLFKGTVSPTKRTSHGVEGTMSKTASSPGSRRKAGSQFVKKTTFKLHHGLVTQHFAQLGPSVFSSVLPAPEKTCSLRTLGKLWPHDSHLLLRQSN